MKEQDVVKVIADHYKVKAKKVDVTVKNYSKSVVKVCFDNSYRYVSDNMRASYIVGYCLILDIPVEHAWIKEGGKYFDVTLKDNVDKVFIMPSLNMTSGN